jgi:DNA invertase Pin-like site-specific DNA recombinase
MPSTVNLCGGRALRGKYAEDRGWQVVGDFVDKHKSAFRKVEREGSEALLAATDAGKIDAIITRHQDRLTRHPETYGLLLKICVRHGIWGMSVTGSAAGAKAPAAFETGEGRPTLAFSFPSVSALCLRT